MPDYNRTAYYIDRDAVRAIVAEEIAVRGVSYAEIFEQTGVGAAGLGRFMDPDKKAGVSGDAMVTLLKWAGADINRAVKRRRSVARHVDTFEQRKLRAGQAYLKHLGVETETGETSVDALMRLVKVAKENGFLG